VGLEGFEELHQDLVLGLLALKNVGVALSVVDALDVVDVNVSVGVSVELGIGLEDNLLSGWGHGSNQSSQEFIVVDGSGVVNVEELEEGLDFSIREAEHVVLHGFGELVHVKRSRVVVVHDAERFAEADHSTGAS
jgi:hypothetical protein